MLFQFIVANRRQSYSLCFAKNHSKNRTFQVAEFCNNGFFGGTAQNGANPGGFASISTKPQRKIRVPKSGLSINALANFM
ncbi:MAG: hypothetical protein IJ043_04385 [Clostridia bacterium]|nr:hypothetical protein [Clostridia bacterium]